MAGCVYYFLLPEEERRIAASKTGEEFDEGVERGGLQGGGHLYGVRHAQGLEAAGGEDGMMVEGAHGEQSFQYSCGSHGVTVVAFEAVDRG